MNKKQKTLLNIGASLLPIIIIIVLWIIASNVVDNSYILPSFKEVVVSFFNLFTYKEFYTALLSTLLRSTIAFLVSFLFAFLLCLLSMKSTYIKRSIRPFISILRALPTIAVVLILLVWTNDNVAPVLVTILVILPTTYTGLCNAFNVIDKNQLEMCKVFNVKRKDKLKKVIIPQVLPEIYNIIGSNLSLNIKLMVAAEVIAYTAGSIGNYLKLADVYDQTGKMLALVVAVVIVGLLIEGIFSLMAKRSGKWRK